MLVLVALAAHGSADAEEVTGWLGLPVALAEAVCADLEAAGPAHDGAGVVEKPADRSCNAAPSTSERAG